MNNHDSAAPDRFRRLAQLLTNTPDPQACTNCLQQLDRYVEAQQAGSDYQKLMPEVAQHLDQCVDCAEAYGRRFEEACARCTDQLEDYIAAGSDDKEQMREVTRHLERCVACTEAHRLLLEALADDSVDQHSDPAFVTPTPDLSFLLPNATDPVAPAQLKEQLGREQLREQLRALLGRATQHSGTGLRLRLSPDLLALSQRPLAGAAMRGREQGEVFRLELEAPGQTVKRLSIACYPTGQPGRCDLEVTVAATNRTWLKQGGIAVELHFAGETRRDQTNAQGMVHFPDLPEAALPEAELLIAV